MAKQKQTNTSGFRTLLMRWNKHSNHRQMPWKGEKDPYKIWLSEIILQQTRVEQGWAYYEKFIKHYPSVFHLAKAKDDDVFKLWEGLGYYSRCKNLLYSAREIVEKYDGRFPDSYEAILKLKGIGPYTAAAIGSFAFNLPHAVIDGNVYRVLARYFGISTPSDSIEGKKLFAALSNDCLDTKQPGPYNQAIMDFGATVCTPANPQCTNCILKKGCVALAENLVTTLPIKEKQLQKRNRWFNYFIIENEGQVLIRKRIGTDIWQNLYEFFLIESFEEISWTDNTVKKHLKTELGVGIKPISISEMFIQKLTHQTIHARFIRVRVNASFTMPPGFAFHPTTLLKKLAFPKTITGFMNNYL